MQVEEEKLSAEDALKLLNHTAVCLALNVPRGVEFGVDMRSWLVGENFKGVKFIPPGVHLLYWSVPNASGGAGSPITGQFIALGERDVVVHRWDRAVENMIADDEWDVDERMKLAVGVNQRRFDQFLGTCPSAQRLQWEKLTSFIDGALLKRLSSPSGRVSSLADQLPANMRDVPARAEQRPAVVSRSRELAAKRHAERVAARGGTVLPSMEEWVSAMKPRFTPINENARPPNCAPADVTRYALDKSYALQQLIDTQLGGAWEPLLGELQFSFVVFFVCAAFSGFEQWKKLVILLCSCEEALQTHAPLYYELLAVLHFQLCEMPTDLFQDPVTGRNFLVPMLSRLFDNIETQCGGDAKNKLHRRAVRFKKNVEEKFGQTFDEDDDSGEPVIVDIYS